MFRTEVNIPKSDFLIKHQSGILTVGSCFAENIGDKLSKAYFNVDINPFGVQFNPISIADNLNRLIEGISFSENDLFLKDDLWSSFSHSTLFSNISAVECLKSINDNFEKGRNALLNADVLLITFGTAWVYEYSGTKNIVNNCHKLPSSEFKRYRLDVSEIIQKYNDLIVKIRKINPDILIVFSVSPVRHLKDGAHENTISKAVLHLAIDELVRSHVNTNYFPAYELLIDELRDYRFFADDMCHPTDLAVNYIWEKFQQSYFDNNQIEIIKKFESLYKRLEHRVIHLGSTQELKFRESTNDMLDKMKKQFPYVNFNNK